MNCILCNQEGEYLCYDDQIKLQMHQEGYNVSVIGEERESCYISSTDPDEVSYRSIGFYRSFTDYFQELQNEDKIFLRNLNTIIYIKKEVMNEINVEVLMTLLSFTKRIMPIILYVTDLEVLNKIYESYRALDSSNFILPSLMKYKNKSMIMNYFDDPPSDILPILLSPTLEILSDIE